MMKKYRPFSPAKYKISDAPRAVIHRLINGEKLTQYRVRFSMVRGCPAGRESWKFPNGDKVSGSVINYLENNHFIRTERIEDDLIFGYHSNTYEAVLTDSLQECIVTRLPLGYCIVI